MPMQLQLPPRQSHIRSRRAIALAETVQLLDTQCLLSWGELRGQRTSATDKQRRHDFRGLP